MNFGLARVLIVTLCLCFLHFRFPNPLAPISYGDDVVLVAPLHRAAMFNIADRPLGSRETFLRGELVLPAFTHDENVEPYRRKTVLVPCLNITLSIFQALAALPVRGMLVESCDSAALRDEALSQLLLNDAVNFPVYHLARGDSIVFRQLEDALKDGRGANDASTMVVKVGDAVPEMKPLASAHSVLVEGVLRRKTRAAAPHVLLSAHLDTLTIAPSLPSSNNVFAVPAVVEVWRRLGLTPDDGASALPDITVLLGSTSRLQFAGTRDWLAKAKKRGSLQYSFALCVEELLAKGDRDGPFYVHIHSAFEKSEKGRDFLAAVHAAAEAAGVRIEVIASKSRYHHNALQWEHDGFAHHSVPSATFSSLRLHDAEDIVQPHAPGALSSNAIDLVMKRVDFLHRLVEALGGINHSEEAQPTGGRRFVEGLSRFFAQSLRVSSSLQARSLEGPQQEEVFEELSKVLQASVAGSSWVSSTEVTRGDLAVKGKLALYASPTQTLTIYRRMHLPLKLMYTCVSVMLLLVYSFCNFMALKSNKKQPIK